MESKHTTGTPRRLGRSDLEVSALGLGCWAIGGPFSMLGQPDGWGEIDDEESIRAIRHAVDLGVTFFDTADAYGTGHSERILGKALDGLRDQVVIATKFGYTYDEARRDLTGADPSPAYVRWACEASLQRLGTDYIDLYQLHVGDLPLEQALPIQAVLEDLVAEGKIRAYGWSTDDVSSVEGWADGGHFAAVQHELNLFSDAPAMLDACDRLDLASINRTPLAMGLLTGKFAAGDRLPDDDVRANAPWLRWFRDGGPSRELLERLDAVREVLCAEGRTLTQGALGWILARSPRTIPIPGFKSVRQVTENAGVLHKKPLTPADLAEIEKLLTAD
ncbi:MAG TPA: aldo/keto reductase [Actinopolymorphaceae bacterium]